MNGGRLLSVTPRASWRTPLSQENKQRTKCHPEKSLNWWQKGYECFVEFSLSCSSVLCFHPRYKWKSALILNRTFCLADVLEHFIRFNSIPRITHLTYCFWLMALTAAINRKGGPLHWIYWWFFWRLPHNSMISLNILNREEGTLKAQNLQTSEYIFSRNMIQFEKSKSNICHPALEKG